jgi:hypothetical protein
LDFLVNVGIADDVELSSAMKDRHNVAVDRLQTDLLSAKQHLEALHKELLTASDPRPIENDIRMVSQRRQRLMEAYVKEAGADSATWRLMDKARAATRSKVLVYLKDFLCVFRPYSCLFPRTRQMSCFVRYRRVVVIR